MAVSTNDTAWLRVSDAARYLSLSTQTVRKLIHAGELPASRVGDVEIRIHRDDLDSYLRTRRITGPARVRDGRRWGKKPGPKPRGEESSGQRD